MANPIHTDHILRQGKALARAIEALSTLESNSALERAAARVLLYAYKRRLRGVVGGCARVDGRGDTERVGAYWG